MALKGLEKISSLLRNLNKWIVFQVDSLFCFVFRLKTVREVRFCELKETKQRAFFRAQIFLFLCTQNKDKNKNKNKKRAGKANGSLRKLLFTRPSKSSSTLTGQHVFIATKTTTIWQLLVIILALLERKTRAIITTIQLQEEEIHLSLLSQHLAS